MHNLYLLFLLLPFGVKAIELDSIYDQVFVDHIKTVQLFPRYNNIQNEILPPILKLNQQAHLELNFDDLSEDGINYAAKIVHCNKNWKPSILVSTDYLSEYNEFQVNDENQSFNTQTFYTHFKFSVPKVTKSGNYGLILYDMDSEDLVLCKRFIIFEELIKILPKTNYADLRSSKGLQSFNFDIVIGDNTIESPSSTIKVAMLQNNRWDNAKNEIKPFTINEAGGTIQYRIFNSSEQFNGGNEFRMFDARSTNFSGKNIAFVDDSKLPHEIFVQYDKNRNYHTYQDDNDINGGFLIDHYEFGDGEVNADYTYVHFTLEYPYPNKSIFVFGGLTNWKLKREFKLRFNNEKKRYEGRALLKQGYYNYRYVIDGKDEVKLEGSYTNTENKYDIIVYYRPFGERYDQVIGHNTSFINKY